MSKPNRILRRPGVLLAVLALLAGAAGLAGAGARPAAAVAAPTGGKITIYSSPGIHFSTQSYTDNSITAGPDGALWFTNPGNNTIGRITTNGQVTDYAGAGIANPWAITAGPDGAVWFTNWNTPSIGRISASGAVTTWTGAINDPASLTVSRWGALWYTNWGLSPKTACSWSIGRMTTRGTSSCYKAKGIVYPQNITAGPDGALWFTDGGSGGTGYAIGRITVSGHVTLFPLAHYPGYIAAGSDGALWFTYPGNNAIGRITTKGVLTSYATTGLSDPGTITAGPDGALWFTATNAIGRITTKGQVTSYPVAQGLSPAGGDIAAGPDGAIWFTNAPTSTIGRITTNVTPTIFGKTPISGPPGTVVTVTGRNLSQARQVTFNGTPAAILSDTASYVVVVVPAAATTGPIAVTTRAGTATTKGWFTVTPAALRHYR